MNKIKQKLQARAKFNKGKRVGYAKGRPVVDRETGEILENFKPAPKPAPAPATRPAPAPAPAPPVSKAQTPTERVPTPSSAPTSTAQREHRLLFQRTS
jgi:hypothetical protein